MPYTFQPRILLSIFCLVLVLVFSSLGVWQLQRSQEKQDIHTKLEALEKLPPHKLNSSEDELRPATKASAFGHYLANDQFLLDNIIYQGSPGYYLLTPFKLEGSEKIILVNRGWLAKKSNSLPNIVTPSEQIAIHGRLALPRSKPVILGGIDHPISDTPPLWYYMDIDIFQEHSAYEVLPLILRLDPDPGSDFVRDWPKYEAKSGMHIGYAIQWFVFAFFVLIGLIGINIKRKAAPNNNKINSN